MESRRDREEELLMRILQAGRKPEDPELRRALAEDGDLRRRVAELWELDAALGAAGEALRDEAQQALAAVTPGGDADLHAAGVEGSGAAADRVRVRVLELAASPGPTASSGASRDPDSRRSGVERMPRSPWNRSSLGWLAAGVAIVALSLRFLLTPAGAPPDSVSAPEALPRGPVVLGTRLTGLSPSGAVERFGTFSWSDLDLGMGRYEVEVVERGSGAPVTLERGLRRPRWTPDPSQAAAWPDSIRWTVSAYDASGALVATAEATAERASD